MNYCDHNSTTSVMPEVVDAMMPWLTSQCGNPSSSHTMGRAARRAVEEARYHLAALVGAEPDQVVFTSGATEANNSALHCAIMASTEKRHIVTSSVEHSAVLSYCNYLERRHRASVTRLPVSIEGEVVAEDVRAAIRPDTALVSLIWANNETGVVWPISEFGKICQEHGTPLHTDAVQAVGRIPVCFSESSVSYLTLSGHKMGAPKGIGALVLAKPEIFEPLIHGGKQEAGHRGGTESVPLIVALGKAAEIAAAKQSRDWSRIKHLRDWLEERLLNRLPTAKINGAGSARLPNTTNLYVPGCDGDALVMFLDQKGICVSSGSACLQHAITPSHVILAMTGSYERASESIRVSLGPQSVQSDLEPLIDALERFVAIQA